MANTRSFKPKTGSSSSLDIDTLVGAEPQEAPAQAADSNQQTNDYRNDNQSGGGYRDRDRDNDNGGGRYDRGYNRRGNGGGYNDGGNRSSNSSYNNEQQMRDVPTEQVNGYLDVQQEGHGFLRPKQPLS